MSGSFEAALNLLREELLAVAEVRRTIMGDRMLREDDPAHHHALMSQTRSEQAQITRAITLLEQVEAGDAVVMAPHDVGGLTAAAGRAKALQTRPRPSRDYGLVKRTVEVRA